MSWEKLQRCIVAVGSSQSTHVLYDLRALDDLQCLVLDTPTLS